MTPLQLHQALSVLLYVLTAIMIIRLLYFNPLTYGPDYILFLYFFISTLHISF